jgi:predicted nuclease of predicted toxin-antitoxin system
MKFIADVNIEKNIVDELRNMSYDVKWIAEVDPYLEDTEILNIAHREDRILITNDKDFGEIVFRQKLLSSGILLLRVKGQDVKEKINLLRKILIFPDKLKGHFVVVTGNKIRFIIL